MNNNNRISSRLRLLGAALLALAAFSLSPLHAATFNKTGGFTINGPSSLTVSNTTGTSSANLLVNAAQADGTAVINTSLFLDTGSSGGKFMVIRNDDAAVTAGPSLIISNTLAAKRCASSPDEHLEGGLEHQLGRLPRWHQQPNEGDD